MKSFLLKSIPNKWIDQWRQMIRLLCRISGGTTAMVGQTVASDLNILAAYRNGMPLEGESATAMVQWLAPCFRKIIRTGFHLEIMSLADYPEIDHSVKGMWEEDVFIGVPIKQVEPTVFGVICVLAKHPDGILPETLELMMLFGQFLETQLALLEKDLQLTHANSELKKAFQQVAKQGNSRNRTQPTDPLTKLMSRHTFPVMMEHIRGRQHRLGEKVCFILADVDHFQKMDKLFGSEAGDLILQYIAELFYTRKRKQDMLWRWENDKFLLVLPGTNLEGAKVMAESLRCSVEESQYSFKRSVYPITMSFGLAELGPDESPNVCLDRCGRYLNQAKAMGRNRIVWE